MKRAFLIASIALTPAAIAAPEATADEPVANLEWPEDQELHGTAFDDGGATVPAASTDSPPGLKPASTALFEPSSRTRDGKEREMTLYSRSSRWAVALTLGLAGVIGIGAATVLAAPARSAASAFELTLETTFEGNVEWPTVREGFRSRAPFCAAGRVVHVPSGTRFTCNDGTGSLTVLVRITTWQILDGSGRYAGLRGRGRVRVEPPEIWDSGVTYRSMLGGVADTDAVAPTAAFSSATAAKLPAGAYAVRVGIALRDDVPDNPVSYTLRASAGGRELARRFGTAGTEPVSMTLRIRPPAGARTVRLVLTGEDPIGNTVSVTRALSLPR